MHCVCELPEDGSTAACSRKVLLPYCPRRNRIALPIGSRPSLERIATPCIPREQIVHAVPHTVAEAIVAVDDGFTCR